METRTRNHSASPPNTIGTQSLVFRVLETHSSLPRGGEWHVSPQEAKLETKSSSTTRARTHLADLFLPSGFPESVREGYYDYQRWSLVQGLAGYLRGALAMKELLRGMGVGDAQATAAAGAIGWIVRDGAGMTSSLVFSWWAATDFDRSVRQWKIFSDVVNNIGLTLNMLAPIFGPNGFLVATIGGSVFTSICGVAGGATGATISQWFAKTGNIADCVAKQGTQQTAVNVLGLLGGLALCVLSENIIAVWTAFLILTVIHSLANVRAVRILRFNTINEHRFAALFERFRHCRKADLSVHAIADVEPWLPSVRASGVIMGHNLASSAGITSDRLAFAMHHACSAGSTYALVQPEGNSSVIHVLLHPKATGSEILKARFLAQAMLTQDLPNHDDAEWFAFKTALDSYGWDTDRSLLPVGEWRYDWSLATSKDE